VDAVALAPESYVYTCTTIPEKIKGIVSRDGYFFKNLKIKSVLLVCALMVTKFFELLTVVKFAQSSQWEARADT
jgi:hypothetical protein